MPSFRIVSLWDLQNFHNNVFGALAFIGNCCGEWQLMAKLLRYRGQMPIATLGLPLETGAAFIVHCERLEAAAAVMQARSLRLAAERARLGCMDMLALRQVHDARQLEHPVMLCQQLLQVWSDELSATKLLYLPVAGETLLSDEPQFGAAVEDAFPNASHDIQEASKCLAFERWTASVMHLMRVVEVGMRALAAHHGLDADGNWNQTLSQIEAKTRETGKRSHGAEAEQWAAEAVVHLRFVKNAWRNHAMHAHAIYDRDRAVAIHAHTRDFMQHLATKLSADGS